MKRAFMTALAVALTAGVVSAQSLKFQTFADSVGINQKNVPIYSTVKVDFPVDGPTALVNSLKTTLSEHYQLPKADTKDGKTFANKLANKNVADPKKKFVEDFDQDDVIPELYIYHAVEKVYETDKILTVMYCGNVFYGGAHDDNFAAGVTYRKSDGRAFGVDILQEGAWDQIQDKVAAGLRKYFDVKSNKELASELMGDGIICTNSDFFIFMPNNPPYVDNGELVFLYSTYEIASFAAGMPEVRIPLKDVMQYLNADFAALVK